MTLDTVCADKPEVVPPASPSSTPLVTLNVVQFVLSFSNGPLSSFLNASGRAAIEASIAKVIGVSTTSVIITRVLNLDTMNVIFTGRRRLQVANVDVTTRLLVENAAKANTLAVLIKESRAEFGVAILTDLKSKDAAYKDCTVSVKADSVTVMNPSVETSLSLPLSLTAIIGIAVGIGVLCLLLGVYVVLKKRFLFSKSIPLKSDSSPLYIGSKPIKADSTVFEIQSPMHQMLAKYHADPVQPIVFHSTGEGNGHVKKILGRQSSSRNNRSEDPSPHNVRSKQSRALHDFAPTRV